nr:immunoglobulin heavy chain junction region [Macaca mulatta]
CGRVRGVNIHYFDSW